MVEFTWGTMLLNTLYCILMIIIGNIICLPIVICIVYLLYKLKYWWDWR